MTDQVETIKNNQISILKTIKESELSVSVQLMNKSFVLDDLLNLNPGSVLTFGVPSSSHASLIVNQKKIGTGIVVDVNGHYGLKVDKLAE